MLKGWKSFSPRDVAHCWIFHESFDDDVRTCLAAYENSTDLNKGTIDWKFLDDLMFGQKKYVSDKKSLASQSKRHAPCSHYFSSEAIGDDIIKASDPFLFRKLGYSSCCSPNSKHIW